MKWTFFPRNKRVPSELTELINIFEKNEVKISSKEHSLKSNDVLGIVADDLSHDGYVVEVGKKDKDKVKIPVLYGENGSPSLNFEVDAYHEKYKIVVEVEAGRAVVNYQFLKDFYEACCMENVTYLCIAVREIYRKNQDYQKVCQFFNSMYISNRFIIPLKGILIIGY